MTFSSQKSNLLKSTCEDTLGPYYPIPFCDDDTLDLTTSHAGLVSQVYGNRIILNGTIKDRFGNLCNGALLEFWQPNANGLYRIPENENHKLIDPWFTGYARTRTKDGSFALKTIMPGIATNGDIVRAPNVTLTIFSDGIMRIVTQIFFEGEKENKNDPLLSSLPEDLQPRLIARKVTNNGSTIQEYSIDIIMAGENETPFFDDLLS